MTLSKTIWQARRAQSGDTERVLCGRLVEGRYVCDQVVAKRPLVGWNEPGVALWLPAGLTDRGTPGEYRWSRYSKDRIGDIRRPKFRDSALTRAVVLDDLPLTAPCPKDHENRLDDALL